MERINSLELVITLAFFENCDCFISETDNTKVVMYVRNGEFIFRIGAENNIKLLSVRIDRHEVDENAVDELNDMNAWEYIQGGRLVEILKKAKEGHPTQLLGR